MSSALHGQRARVGAEVGAGDGAGIYSDDFHPAGQHAARVQLGRVVEFLRERYSEAAAILEAGAQEVLAYTSFAREHWRQNHWTNPLERLNREIGRRAHGVGIVLNRQAMLRLVGAVLIDQNDQWSAVFKRTFSKSSLEKLYGAQLNGDSVAMLLAIG